MTARVGLLLGDASGIGPELVAKLLAERAAVEDAVMVVIGDRRVLERGKATAGVDFDLPVVPDVEAATEGAVMLQGPPIDPDGVTVAEVSDAAGRNVLDTLRQALDLGREGRLDAVCFAPLNKQAMHMAGMTFEDELAFFVDYLGFEGDVGEINATDKLATTRVTSHVPLRAVADLITTQGVLRATRLADRTLRASGNLHPRIAVCGLNPHAGDGGIFGREDIDVIAPAVEQAQGEQIAASGPFPSDTIFIRARDGEFDAVVTMYHDQGQIAMKLMGFDRGVTIHAGLPIPITTPAHGTAFDIAGRGVARVDAMRQAWLTACRMASAQG